MKADGSRYIVYCQLQGVWLTCRNCTSVHPMAFFNKLDWIYPLML